MTDNDIDNDVDDYDFDRFVTESKDVARLVIAVINDAPADTVIPGVLYALGCVVQDFLEEGVFKDKEEAVKHIHEGLDTLLLDFEEAKKKYGYKQSLN